MFDDIDSKNNNENGSKKGVEDIFSGIEPENTPKPFKEKKEESKVDSVSSNSEKVKKDNIKKILILSGLALVFFLFCFASYQAFLFFTKPQEIDTIIINDNGAPRDVEDSTKPSEQEDEEDIEDNESPDDEVPNEVPSGSEDKDIGEIGDIDDIDENDSDEDGVSDYDEINIYKTDSLSSDTDGDGLSDYEEIFTNNTDPLSPDTDNDGLSDYEEVHTYKTNPENPDTDNDGYEDGLEVKGGYNPKGPGSL